MGDYATVLEGSEMGRLVMSAPDWREAVTEGLSSPYRLAYLVYLADSGEVAGRCDVRGIGNDRWELGIVLLDTVRGMRLEAETLDVTMPGRVAYPGHRHPLTTTIADVRRVFESMGFETVEGPEVELTHYNFDLLNTAPNHPARDEQDTFYFEDDVVLRTQTSSVQGRVMETRQPPIRIIAPGRVYRSDDLDATHSPLFHQTEGMLIDRDVRMSDLKGYLEVFAQAIFGKETRVRFRPHHFPFTEPSAEMDVSCFVCGGKGCPLCKGEGWIEILGCGMVHTNVLSACGIDPEKYTGFAFGMGVERIAMLRYKIDEMRQFYDNDLRFLSQFN